MNTSCEHCGGDVWIPASQPPQPTDFEPTGFVEVLAPHHETHAKTVPFHSKLDGAPLKFPDFLWRRISVPK